MLSLKNVSSFYGQSRILQDLSLTLREGEITAVLGRNGMGKSTLLKTVMGLTDREDGEIKLKGRRLNGMKSYQRARSGIAYVPQGREIIPHFTVAENILVGTFANRSGGRGLPRIIGDLFPYLVENLSRRAGLLSGGQQQQLAFARALAAEPDLLLLDEPTEGIQPNIVAEIEQTIVGLNKQHGMTIMIVEQNLEFARLAGDRFIVIEKGRVVSEGEASQFSVALIDQHLAI